MENLQPHYGRAAERIRREKDIPVKTIADKMGSSTSRVYELLKQQNIRTDVLSKLADALGIEPDQLLPKPVNQDRESQLLAEIRDLKIQNAQLTQTVNSLVQLLGKPKGSNVLAIA